MTHLTNYQKFQFERFGNILLQDGSSTQNPNDPRLLPKNYDYEDDDYTFALWVDSTFERWTEYHSHLKIQANEN